MQAWSKALGVECAHCHIPDQWADASKPAFAFAQRMMRMVDGLNAGPLKDLGGITCWSCHRGRTIPARLPRESWERIRAEHTAEFEGQPNRALAMSVYAASLGVDCSHCHEPVRTENTKAPKAMVVARMLPIFEEIPKYFDDARKPVTQCYMCHQGKTKPERGPGFE
jgi:formate-dependent nitrite reductase cytochrome c552 subunit